MGYCLFTLPTGGKEAENRHVAPSTVRPFARDPRVPGPGWLAIAFDLWVLVWTGGRALAAGTAWAGLCLIHHH